MGQALGGLVCPKKRLINRVQELSEKKSGVFAEAVKEFVDMTLKRGAEPAEATGLEFLQEVRSSLTSLRDTLLNYQEIHAMLDSITDLSDSEIGEWQWSSTVDRKKVFNVCVPLISPEIPFDCPLDSLVELSLHKVALKPIYTHLYSCIHVFRTDDGSFKRLQNNLQLLEKKGVEELGGSDGVGIPDSVTLERIQQRWISVHETYSPNKKVQILLKVCKSIYHSMSSNASSGS